VKNKHDFDTVHGAQGMFRILLEALANPGRILNFRRYADQFAGQGRWLAPAITLLDKETGFFWDGDEQTGEEIRFLTGASRVPLDKADFVFLSRGEGGAPPCGRAGVPAYPPNGGAAPVTPPPGGPGPPGPPTARDAARRFLARVKQGTHLDPHTSALLFIAAGTGDGEKPEETVFLTGPGIPPQGRWLDLFPEEAVWCRARDERDFEYPCGVELVFLRKGDSILALTRKTAFLWNNI
jgi:alpha-D-ribose 1-methylphosphonate 5-triphosphate synthase subunit PhnH